MKDYFELLEQDTEDPKIQFELYEACLQGQGEVREEAIKWLELSAQGGNEEAIAILENNNSKTEPTKDYSNMSLIELYEIADYDYDAAKEVYKKFKGKDTDIDFDAEINMLKRIVSFKNSTVEDFEILAHRIISSGSVRLNTYEDIFISACKNAKELGSTKAIKYLLNYKYYNLYTLSNSSFDYVRVDKETGDIHYNYAKKTDIFEKVLFYLILNTNCYSNKSDVVVLRQFWYDDLKNISQISEYPNLEKLVDIVSHDFSRNIIQQVKDLFLDEEDKLRENQVFAFTIVILSNDLLEKEQYIKDYNLNTDSDFIYSLCCANFLEKNEKKIKEKKARLKHNEEVKQRAELQRQEEEERQKQLLNAQLDRLISIEDFEEALKQPPINNQQNEKELAEKAKEIINSGLRTLNEQKDIDKNELLIACANAKKLGDDNALKYLLNYNYYISNVFFENSKVIETINEMHSEFVKKADIVEKVLYYIILNFKCCLKIPNIYCLRDSVYLELKKSSEITNHPSLIKLIDLISTGLNHNILRQVKDLILNNNHNLEENQVLAFVIVLISNDLLEKEQYIKDYNLNTDSDFIYSLFCEQLLVKNEKKIKEIKAQIKHNEELKQLAELQRHKEEKQKQPLVEHKEESKKPKAEAKVKIEPIVSNLNLQKEKVEIPNNNNPQKKPKSKVILVLLCIFGGQLGLHNFYLGYYNRAKVQIALSILFSWTYFVPALIWIWSIVETVQVYNDKRSDANGVYLRPRKSLYINDTNSAANESKIDELISKYFSLLKNNKLVRVISIVIAYIFFAISVLSFFSPKLAYWDANSENIKDYLLKDSIEFNTDAYEGHATITSDPYELVDWTSLSQKYEVKADELKKHFNCEFKGNSDNLKNGDKVKYSVTWDSKDLKKFCNLELKGNGFFNYEIVVANLGKTPALNLFEYVKMYYDGYDGRCRITLVGEETAQKFEDYTIQLAKTESNNYSKTDIVSFNIYQNDMLIDNFVVYLDSSSLKQVDSKNDGTWYEMSAGALVQYKVASTFENSNLNVVKTKTETVPSLNILLTTQNKLSEQSYKKLKETAVKTLKSRYGERYEFEEGAYLVMNQSSNEMDYISAIVFIYSEYGSPKPAQYAIVYDPVIDKNGNLKNYCLEEIHSKEETIFQREDTKEEMLKHIVDFSEVVNLQ